MSLSSCSTTPGTAETDPESNEFGSQTNKSLWLLIWETIFQRDRPTIDVTQTGKPLVKRA
jgi:hypothetical protein